MKLEQIEHDLSKNKESLSFAYYAALLEKNGQYSQARQVCDEGLLIHFGFIAAMLVQGKTLYKMGHYSLAKQQFEHVAMLDGRCPASWKYLLKIALVEKNQERIDDYSKHVFLLDPFYVIPEADEVVVPLVEEFVDLDASQIGSFLDQAEQTAGSPLNLTKDAELPHLFDLPNNDAVAAVDFVAPSAFVMPETPTGDDIGDAVDQMFGEEASIAVVTDSAHFVEEHDSEVTAEVGSQNEFMEQLPQGDDIGEGIDALFEESEKPVSDLQFSEVIRKDLGEIDLAKDLVAPSLEIQEPVESELTIESELNAEVVEENGLSLGEAVASEFDSLFGESTEIENAEKVELAAVEIENTEIQVEPTLANEVSSGIDSLLSEESAVAEESTLGEAVSAEFDSLFGEETVLDVEETPLEVVLEQENTQLEVVSNIQIEEESTLGEAVSEGFDSLFAEQEAPPQSQLFADGFNLESDLIPAQSAAVEAENAPFDAIQRERPDYKAVELSSPDEVGDLDMSFGSFAEYSESPISESTMTMAEIFEQQGHFEKALEIVNDILDLDPENTQAAQKRDELLIKQIQ